MLITNGDRLKHHFENVVDVKLFTVPEILTIIDTFSLDIPEEATLIMQNFLGKDLATAKLETLMNFKSTKRSVGKHEDAYVIMPRHLGMTEAKELQNELRKIIESGAESEGHDNDG